MSLKDNQLTAASVLNALRAINEVDQQAYTRRQEIFAAMIDSFPADLNGVVKDLLRGPQ